MSEGQELTKRFEGCERKRGDLIYPYLCAAGYPTQGWGIVVQDMNAPPITQDEADRRFEAAWPKYEREALAASPVLRDHPNKLGAITSFVYNLGATRYKSSTLRRKVNAQDWDGAADEFGKWVYAGGRKLAGLVRRRAAERELFES